MEDKEKTLLEEWRLQAYDPNPENKKRSERLWKEYFDVEKGIYKQLLSRKDAPAAGSVKELAERYGTDILTMTGFLDGINDSLKEANPIETMDEDTVVNLDYDPERLYKNMVEAKADWLYNLPEWDDFFTEEERKTFYKEQKASHTIVKGPKIGRNDPCPCGSGKKYKFCCGKTA